MPAAVEAAVRIEDPPTQPTVGSSKVTETTADEAGDKQKVVSRKKKSTKKPRMTDSEVINELSE